MADEKEINALKKYQFWKTIFKTEEPNHEEEMLRKPVFSSSVSGCSSCNGCGTGGGGCSGCSVGCGCHGGCST